MGEMINLIARADLLRKVMFYGGLFSEEEAEVLEARSHNNVISFEEQVEDDLDLALLITNGGLTYRTNEKIYNLGITQALLARKIEATYGEKTWFMERDEGKAPTLYETFAGEYFDEMFGDEGKRKLYSGDGEGFMEDLKKYGATEEEISKLDTAINNSTFNGEYIPEEVNFVSKFCKKIAEGRKLYESTAKEQTSEAKKKTL